MGQRGRFDYSRRAVLGFAGAVTLATTLRTKDALAQAPGGKMRIGVIGSGHIGGTIGGLWVKAGHPVLFSSRHPEELKDLVAGLGPLAQAGTVAAGDRVRRRAAHRRALRRAAADRAGLRRRAQGQDHARRLQCRARARRRDRRRGRARRHRRHFAEISARHAAGARLQHALLHDLRTRGEPARSEARGPDCRRRSAKQCRSRPGWCATPASIRWWSASWPTRAASSAALRAMARTVSAAELRQKLSLTP